MLKLSSKFMDLSFLKYSFIGIFNTLLHFFLFYFLVFLSFKQALANLLAFLSAATFSYFMNAKFTFKSLYNFKKYLLFLLIMGILSFSLGFLADIFHLPALLTPIIFSALSLVLGFLLSKFFIFGSSCCLA